MKFNFRLVTAVFYYITSRYSNAASCTQSHFFHFAGVPVEFAQRENREGSNVELPHTTEKLGGCLNMPKKGIKLTEEFILKCLKARIIIST